MTMRSEADQLKIANIIAKMPLRYPQIQAAWHYKNNLVEYICYELDHRPNFLNITQIKASEIEEAVKKNVELRCNICLGVCNVNQKVELGVSL